MNENALNSLLNKIGNIEARQHALEVEFIDYTEKNPKSCDQWTEERIRALELQVKELKERLEAVEAADIPASYNPENDII